MNLTFRQRRIDSIAPRTWEIVVGLAAPAVVFGLLFSGEIILRVQQYLAFGPNQAVETKIEESVWDTSNGRRRPRPGAVMGQIRFNGAGFRGPELAMPKPPGTIRIGFFGSSTTMDPYVENESETWPSVATSVLKTALPHCRVDYFNAGVPGYNIDGSRRRLFEDALPYQPDIAVFLLNDINSRAHDQLVARGLAVEGYRPTWLAEHSLLWEKVEKNATAERLKRVAARTDVSHRLDFGNMQAKLSVELDALVSAVVAKDIEPVFVGNATRIRREQPLSEQIENSTSRVLYMPDVYIGDITSSFYYYNDTLRSIARARHIPYVETVDQMPAGAAFYVDTSHTTAKGSAIFGEIVGRRLLASPDIRTLIKTRGSNCS